MILSSIAAMASNRVIGSDGDLPWSLPEDMKFFKEKTAGHIILMGRKTFDSFKGRLLPRRLHVVISRRADFRPEGVHVFPSLKPALEFCRSQTSQWGDEVFVIGGGQIYRELLPLTDRIYLTEIHREFPGDARFPDLPEGDFREVERRPRPGDVPFDFVIYERVAKSFHPSA